MTHFQSTYALPIHAPKGAYYAPYPAPPAEYEDSASSISGVPSYSHNGFTNSTASYIGAPSVGYESARSASGVDFQDYMQERFSHSFNPIPLDRSVAVQAQASGKMNAKHRELLDLQRQAQARLARTRERFQEGMRDAREVRGDLEWTQKKVATMQSKAARMHPKEYTKARARYPSPEC